jgi:hypothetical protein
MTVKNQNMLKASTGDGDLYGYSVASLNDLDGDNVPDLAVGEGYGTVWIYLLNADGTVKSDENIVGSPVSGETSWFGSGMTVADLDGDGYDELVVADADNLAVAYFNTDGTIREWQGVGLPLKAGVQDPEYYKYHKLSFLNDPDGNGVNQLVVGAINDEAVGAASNSGVVYILTLEFEPTPVPTPVPSEFPTESPTESPTDSPTESPTNSPTESPTNSPTESPTNSPTESPTASPTESPTESPSKSPTPVPTKSPTPVPTKSPTPAPSKAPSSPATTTSP